MLTSTNTIQAELENSSPALWITWSSFCAGTLDSSGRLSIANAVRSALFIQQHHRANSLSGASVRTNACTTTTHHAIILPCLWSFSHCHCLFSAMSTWQWQTECAWNPVQHTTNLIGWRSNNCRLCILTSIFMRSQWTKHTAIKWLLSTCCGLIMILWLVIYEKMFCLGDVPARFTDWAIINGLEQFVLPPSMNPLRYPKCNTPAVFWTRIFFHCGLGVIMVESLPISSK